jgi:tRNA G37 N-methylase Trm5
MLAPAGEVNPVNREARIYLLAVDADERRILMRLPDGALTGVEKVKAALGKGARVLSYEISSHETTTCRKERDARKSTSVR